MHTIYEKHSLSSLISLVVISVVFIEGKWQSLLTVIVVFRRTLLLQWQDLHPGPDLVWWLRLWLHLWWCQHRKIQLLQQVRVYTYTRSSTYKHTYGYLPSNTPDNRYKKELFLDVPLTTICRLSVLWRKRRENAVYNQSVTSTHSIRPKQVNRSPTSTASVSTSPLTFTDVNYMYLT